MTAAIVMWLFFETVQLQIGRGVPQSVSKMGFVGAASSLLVLLAIGATKGMISARFHCAAARTLVFRSSSCTNWTQPVSKTRPTPRFRRVRTETRSEAICNVAEFNELCEQLFSFLCYNISKEHTDLKPSSDSVFTWTQRRAPQSPGLQRSLELCGGERRGPHVLVALLRWQPVCRVPALASGHVAAGRITSTHSPIAIYTTYSGWLRFLSISWLLLTSQLVQLNLLRVLFLFLIHNIPTTCYSLNVQFENMPKQVSHCFPLRAVGIKEYRRMRHKWLALTHAVSSQLKQKTNWHDCPKKKPSGGVKEWVTEVLLLFWTAAEELHHNVSCL